MQDFRVWLRKSISIELEEGNKVPHYFKPMSESDVPACPKCSNPMVLRTNRARGTQFYGCSQYPNCNGTMGYNSQTGQGYQSASQKRAVQQQPQQRSTNVPQRKATDFWILAKTQPSASQVGLTPDTYVAMKQVDQENWRYVEIDPDENRIGRRGLLPTQELRNLIAKETDQTGKTIVGNKPSELIQKLKGPKSAKGSGMLPDEHMTDEGKQIEARFEQMINGEASDHMVINALAGSGKTTMLKHLAFKYGKPGQNWLYLVFNKKNEQEASGEFPKFVKVRTTNGYAGDVLGDNNIKPTERIVSHHYAEKAKLIVDGPQFQSLLRSMNIPEPRAPDKKLTSYLKSINYEFSMEVIKLLGLAKSFAIDPRQEETLDQAVEDVIGQYDLNTHLEKVKERIQKGSNPEYYNQEISQMMQTQSFLDKDFAEEMKQATVWLMQKTMPHGIDQEFQGAKGEFKDKPLNLKGMRDFNDDLWYAATHADELDWNKPRRWDVVLADEVQDFNKAQKIILEKLHETGAKIVAVGDPNQAIYRFRGADSKAFSGLSDSLTNLSANPQGVGQTLSKNFRSRKNILDFVNDRSVVNGLQQGKSFKSDGTVSDREMDYEGSFETLKAEKDEMGEVKQTAFISRTNGPLTHTALRLLKDNVPFIIVGKEMGKELIEAVNNLSRAHGIWDDNPVYELQEALSQNLQEKQEKWFGITAKAGKLADLKENTEALLAASSAAMEENEDIDVAGFKDWLKMRLGGVDMDNMSAVQRRKMKQQMEEQNPVVLTTAHRSKGLEFERVFILRDDQFPHPRAQRDEDLEQEENARYVAYTRAMDELHILDPEGQPGYGKGNGNGGGSMGYERPQEDRPREKRW